MILFDIAKAFLGIQLYGSDQNKLLCLWYKNVQGNDFSLIIYKNLRLSFGLRPSPTILTLALYRILVMDTDNDDYETIKLKRMIYNSIYMDNGIVTTNDPILLRKYYEQLPKIFDDYQFKLQQFVTNDTNLQADVDRDFSCTTEDSVKFFGMSWNKKDDKIGPNPIKLDANANTKRKILSSLNSVYDLLNVYGPILNRSKIFFQKLQVNKIVGWDTPLDESMLHEWKLVCRQANGTPAIRIDRFIGDRESHYDLVAFSDASVAIYGIVIYSIAKPSGRVSFISAKNKVVNTTLAKKSIPTLECQAVAYAAEKLIELSYELTGDKNLLPVTVDKLYIYTDSMVTLSWLKGYFINYDKMQKRSVLVMNRLSQINNLCNSHPITFRYIEGKENPADYISRPVSYNQLKRTNYFSGPNFLSCMPRQPDIEVTVPPPSALSGSDMCNTRHTTCNAGNVTTSSLVQPLVNVKDYSSLSRIVNTNRGVLKFINRLRNVVGKPSYINEDDCMSLIISLDQRKYFGDVFDFFNQRELRVSSTPNLVLQMNLFIDSKGVIRIKSKFRDGPHPILLHYASDLTKLIVLDIHGKFSHSGKFTILKELRKDFWLLRSFSTVKKILSSCVTCRKLNARNIKLNQSNYREFRMNPPRVAFSHIFLDFIGPLNVRLKGKIQKMWILIVTCLWSRAVSLKLCFSANTQEFLRSLQKHTYEYGMFVFCLSDLGSQIVSGAKQISNFLNDPECTQYLSRRGVKQVTFDHYAKGNSSLGSLVESMVKQTKRLLIKSIGKQILDFQSMDLLVCKTAHVMNRRPLIFKEYLTDSEQIDVPTTITPENLIFARELLSLNIIPYLVPFEIYDGFKLNSSEDSLVRDYAKLRKVNDRLVDTYSQEFLSNLVEQATSKKGRFKPIKHESLNIGDVVLLKEDNTKMNNFPLGIVRQVTKNSLGEVTSAVVFKGGTREEVTRHSTSLILLLKSAVPIEDVPTRDTPHTTDGPPVRNSRQAAVLANDKTSKLYTDDLAEFTAYYTLHRCILFLK